MGGDYPTGRGEFYFAGDPAIAAYVSANNRWRLRHRSLARSIDHGRPAACGRHRSVPTPCHFRGDQHGGYVRSPFTTPSWGCKAITPWPAPEASTRSILRTVTTWSATGGKTTCLGKLLGDGQLASVYDALVAGYARIRSGEHETGAEGIGVRRGSLAVHRKQRRYRSGNTVADDLQPRVIPVDNLVNGR